MQFKITLRTLLLALAIARAQTHPRQVNISYSLSSERLVDIKSTKFYAEKVVLWRTINLGRAVIGLTSKCEAGIMFN
jgi:hypothetical protein